MPMTLKDVKDLLLIALFGFIYYAIVIGLSGDILGTPSLTYFIAPTLIPLFLGFIIRHSEQVLEWPLAFLFGGSAASIVLVLFLGALGSPLSMPHFALVLRNTIFWFGMMSALWMMALLLGFFLKMTFDLIVGSLVR